MIGAPEEETGEEMTKNSQFLGLWISIAAFFLTTCNDKVTDPQYIESNISILSISPSLDEKLNIYDTITAEIEFDLYDVNKDVGYSIDLVIEPANYDTNTPLGLLNYHMVDYQLASYNDTIT
ncbi:MAG: hypothetical protein GF311_28665, partial [Candidatus Lokiarchaeota archaeon]|nr:hypothetical protein [Candidatus Lokiarchaeota archaeon]